MLRLLRRAKLSHRRTKLPSPRRKGVPQHRTLGGCRNCNCILGPQLHGTFDQRVEDLEFFQRVEGAILSEIVGDSLVEFDCGDAATCEL